MSKPEEENKYAHLEGKKKPWEDGFEFEEAEQKADARKRKGDDPNAIRDTAGGE